MLLIPVVMLLLDFLASPLTLQAQAVHREDTLISFTIAHATFFIKRQYKRVKTPSGSVTIKVTREGSAQPVSTSPARKERLQQLFQALMSSHTARRFLLAHTQLEQLDLHILLHTSTAAQTALWAGALDALGRLPPIWQRRIRLRCLPDFFQQHTQWAGRCIIRLKPGTLLITLLRLLPVWAAEQIHMRKEAESWNTLSES